MDAAEAIQILDVERERGLALIDEAASLEELEAARVSLLGRKARFTEVQKALGGLADEDRRTVGKLANETRAVLNAELQARGAELERAGEAEFLEADGVDVTLPGRHPRSGSLHPLSIVENDIVDTFTRMGYVVAEGPEIEDDWHNFEALNIPPDHPARTMKDSLYLAIPGLLLRTETSAVQIRTMESQDPPVYIVVPGRVFRREAADTTHSSVFHQVECLAVDEGLSFAHLRGTLEAFARAMFGPRRRIRLNPTYFPFVEPGAEVEVSCFTCDGVGCKVCGNGWIELLGSGMVHPNVLENCGYDSERYTGFAFGMGIERVAILRYEIPDMRMLLDTDIRLLAQFGAA